MQKISTKIDWLTYTIFGMPEVDSVYGSCVIAEDIYRRVTGDINVPPSTITTERHYRYVHVYPKGLRVRVGNKRVGCSVVIPSGAIAAYELSPDKMHRLTAMDDNVRATRVDYAVDIFGFNADHCLLDIAGKLGADRRNVSVWYKASKITGVNIGSRKSDVYIRLYDKGVETQSGIDWLRVEAEYKGPMALTVASRLINLEYVYADVLSRIKTKPIDNAVYEIMLESATVDVARLHAVDKTAEPSNDYLNRVVRPYVLRQARDNPDFVLQYLYKLLDDVQAIQGDLGSRHQL